MVTRFNRAQLDAIRLANDVDDPRAYSFVREHLEHPDPRVAAVAQRVIDRDLTVAELVALVEEVNHPEDVRVALTEAMRSLGPEKMAELRRRTGTDPESLRRELLEPEIPDLGPDGNFVLDQAGLRTPAAQEKFREGAAEVLRRTFNLDGLEERQQAIFADAEADGAESESGDEPEPLAVDDAFEDLSPADNGDDTDDTPGAAPPGIGGIGS